ncbi:MAG TPA: thiamine biosynthesis protein ApbE, partial [Porphyromonadaceae bacterium]|nr:thiamine biosynthesis protein ApbE [Porphyromonadaceae bacterium]
MHREQNKSQQYHAQVRFLFHATVKIKIPVAYSVLLLDDLFSIMESVDYQYNSYRKDSYFDLINRSAGSFVEVDDVTIFLLKKIKEVASF